MFQCRVTVGLQTSSLRELVERIERLLQIRSQRDLVVRICRVHCTDDLLNIVSEHAVHIRDIGSLIRGVWAGRTIAGINAISSRRTRSGVGKGRNLRGCARR
jgi:hypothetical protein